MFAMTFMNAHCMIVVNRTRSVAKRPPGLNSFRVAYGNSQLYPYPFTGTSIKTTVANIYIVAMMPSIKIVYATNVMEFSAPFFIWLGW